MKQRITIIVCCLMAALGAQARHIAEVGLHAGASGMFLSSTYGNCKPGINTGLDLSYIYLSDVYIGLRIGASLDMSRAAFLATQYSDAYSVTDPNGDPVNFSYTIDSWRENYTQIYFAPVVQLGVDIRGWRLFAGPKFFLPLSMRYSESMQGADIQAYFPNEDNTLQGDVYALNLGKKDMPAQSGKMVSQPIGWYALAVETGYAIPLSYNQGLYISAYANIGFNRCTPSASAATALSLSDFDAGLPLTRSMTSAMQAHNLTKNDAVIYEFGYWDAGIKLTWQMSWGNARRRYNTGRHTCHCYEP